MATRFHLSTRPPGRVPSFLTLLGAVLLVPVLAVAWLFVGGLLLLIGTAFAAVAAIVLLIALWRAHRLAEREGQAHRRRDATIEADYYIVEERERR